MRQMTASELDARLRAGDQPPLLLDVREPWEFAICHIEGAQLLPMGRIVASLDQLERDRETVVICHHGIRSQQVAYFLDQQGFSRIVNLVGGVAAWARDVDREMATY
jgi:rhodanese-related sulfurtransferase